MKKNLLLIAATMIMASSLTYGQHQYRPLPIYRYMVDGYPDNLNVMDSSAASLALDTTTLPYPVGPALTWGGWDTAHLSGSYNWTIDHYTVGGFNELKGNGYKTGTGNIATDQWYISPYFSTKKYTGVTLSFASACAKYPGPAPIVMVSTSFRNEIINPAQWDTLKNTGIVNTVGISAAISLHPSAQINLDSYQGDSVCIAFRYTSTTGGAATVYLDSISITGTQVVGIKNINTANNKVAVYPNPAMSNVTIESPLHSVIEILNIEGQLIRTLASNSIKTNINVSALPGGVYVVEVKTGNSTEVRKFVKE